jgi:hypothetical protein
MRRESDRPPERRPSRSPQRRALLLLIALSLAACSHASFQRELPASKVQQAAKRPPWRTPNTPTTLTPTQLRAQLQTLVDAMLKAEGPAVRNAESHPARTDNGSRSLNVYLRFFPPDLREQVTHDLNAALANKAKGSSLPHNRRILLTGDPLPQGNGCLIVDARLTQSSGSTRSTSSRKALLAFSSSPSISYRKSSVTFKELSDTRLYIVAIFGRAIVTPAVAKEICAG